MLGVQWWGRGGGNSRFLLTNFPNTSDLPLGLVSKYSSRSVSESMLMSKPLVLFQNFENTVICFCMYISLGFEFVKERNDIVHTPFITKPFEC